MTIQITWHLIVMIVITVLILIGMFSESDGYVDVSSIMLFCILVVMWLIYGGIVFW